MDAQVAGLVEAGPLERVRRVRPEAGLEGVADLAERRPVRQGAAVLVAQPEKVPVQGGVFQTPGPDIAHRVDVVGGGLDGLQSVGEFVDVRVYYHAAFADDAGVLKIRSRGIKEADVFGLDSGRLRPPPRLVSVSGTRPLSL